MTARRGDSRLVSFRKPKAGAVLELRKLFGARGAFAMARDESPVAPATAGWWARVESDALRTHCELAAALLAYSADDVLYASSWLNALRPFGTSAVPACSTARRPESSCPSKPYCSECRRCALVLD